MFLEEEKYTPLFDDYALKKGDTNVKLFFLDAAS